MASGHYEHRSVLLRAVIQIDANGETVVIGVRVERPILMPFDGFADLSGFHVDLGIVNANAGRHQRRQYVHDQGFGDEIGEEIGMFVMRLDPPDARYIRCVRGVEI